MGEGVVTMADTDVLTSAARDTVAAVESLCNAVLDVLDEVRALRAEVADLRSRLE